MQIVPVEVIEQVFNYLPFIKILANRNLVTVIYLRQWAKRTIRDYFSVWLEDYTTNFSKNRKLRELFNFSVYGHLFYISLKDRYRLQYNCERIPFDLVLENAKYPCSTCRVVDTSERYRIPDEQSVYFTIPYVGDIVTRFSVESDVTIDSVELYRVWGR